MEQTEQSQMDVNVEESSVPQESTSVEQSVEPNQEVSAQEQKPSVEDKAPFHEHPRFKELVEQKNKAIEQARSLEERYGAMEAQLKKLTEGSLTQKQEDALISRLKGIDPEFGERFEKLDQTQKELAELRQWKAQVEADKVRTQAVSTVDRLHEQNKVAPELRELYNEQLEAAYARNPQAFLKDIQSAYKGVHDRMTKTLENFRRIDRESYVAGKKADASAPAPKKGGQVPASKEFKFSDDPAEARSQIVKRTLELMKAESGD